MKYRPEIDGLRALAVLPVILFHAGSSFFSGGFVGVDIFFVISGYLITGIIIADIDKGAFSIMRFYERRARRILPALLLVVIACMPFAWLWMLPSQFSEFSKSVVSVVFFASNVFFWKQAGYFAPASEEAPLLHTWSLSVEEQFYIVFPILLLLLARMVQRRNMVLVIGILSILSLALAEWGWRNAPTANFYLIPFRAWELGIGALCQMVPIVRREYSGVLAAGGLAAVIFSIFAYSDTTPFPSAYAVIPVLGTGLLLRYASQVTVVGRLLASKVLVGIGLVSYSAYLWHHPLFAFARIRSDTGHPPLGLMLVLAFASLILAFLSWKFVETPARRNQLFNRKQVLWGASGSLVALSIIGSLGFATGLHRTFWKAMNPTKVATLALVEKASLVGLVDNGECRFQMPELSPAIESRVAACHKELGPGVLVIGDSHGTNLFEGLYQALEAPFLVGVTRGNCRVHNPGLGCSFKRISEMVAAHPRTFRTILYHQAGFHLMQMKSGRKGRKVISGVPLEGQIVRSQFAAREADILSVAEYLSDLARYTSVAWVGPRLEPHISPNHIIKAECSSQFTLRDGQDDLYAFLDKEIDRLLRGSHVRYISLLSAILFNPRTDIIDCSRWLWRDGDHWSYAGTRYFAERLIASGSLNGIAVSGSNVRN